MVLFMQLISPPRSLHRILYMLPGGNKQSAKPPRCYAPDGKHWLRNHKQKDWLAQERGGGGGHVKLLDLCTLGWDWPEPVVAGGH